MRRFTGDTLVIASHNRHKAGEIAAFLAPYVAKFPTAADLNLPEPEETGTTFAENAQLKALAAATASGHPALADDSGLSIAALGGEPGIYSARWAGGDYPAAFARIQSLLQGKPDRSAWFTCALCLAWPDGQMQTVKGRIDGTIATTASGRNGFGYDAVFIPSGRDVTFGEMAEAEKAALSHRKQAFDQLISKMFVELPQY